MLTVRASLPVPAVVRPKSGGTDVVAELACRFAAEHGVDVLQPCPGGDTATRVDGDPLDAVWATLAQVGMPAAGLTFAGWASSRVLGGVFFTLLANAPDVGALLERLHRFHPLFGRSRLVLTRTGGSTSVHLEALDGAPVHPTPSTRASPFSAG
jgi:hypothetical protein